MTDILLETFRALVLAGLCAFLWRAGRRRFRQFRNGWNLILAGFGLLLFGSILDVSDNFENLNRFVVIGDTEIQAFLEKFVGFLGGFLLLAIGLIRWIPRVQGLSDMVDDRTRDLQEINRRLTEEIGERVKAERVKDDFVSTVSHELRTPLTSIKGSLGLIRSGKVGGVPDEVGSMIEIAYKNADRLNLLINDILDIGRVESGRLEYRMTRVDLGELLEQALQANEGYCSEYEVTFEPVNEAPGATVQGDSDRLIQVLSNLLSNAAKFSPPQGRIVASLTRRGGGFRIAVGDHGDGIPEDFRERLFQKFAQADSTDIRTKGGTGLGLYIAKAIVEHHGGTLAVESVPGVGTTFFVDLPEASSEAVASVAAESSRPF